MLEGCDSYGIDHNVLYQLFGDCKMTLSSSAGSDP
jgi:hypothetical protein